MHTWLLRSIALCLTCFLFPHPLSAQLTYPANAQVEHFFAQVADGGTDQQRWQTKFFFVNPSASTVNGQITFFRQDGNFLQVDLGSGSSAAFSIEIPPSGSTTFRTTGTPSNINSGWAYASFDGPVQANAEYRMLVGGSIQRTASVNGVTPALIYRTFADYSSGLAIANPNSSAVTVAMTLRTFSGSIVGQITRTIGPLNQIAVLVNQLFSVSQSFVGSLHLVSTSTLNLPIVSLTLDADSTGLLGSLPHGAFAFPPDHQSIIELVFSQLVGDINRRFPGRLRQVRLQIDRGLLANASASPDGTITISLGLSELLNGETNELAFVIAHELGHVFDTSPGTLNRDEGVADGRGLAFAILAGYDPYGAGGAMGRLLMISREGLLSQIFDDLLDPHLSFTTRLEILYAAINRVCQDPQLSSFCSQYRSLLHPHLPGPLVVPVPPRSEEK